MGLFERMSRVVRAEANYIKSQSIDPEEEVAQTIRLLQNAVIKTQIAIAKTPIDQRKGLERNLANLQEKLSGMTTRRDELIYRMKAEAYLQRVEKLVGNDLSELIGLFEEINRDIAAMKAQLLGTSTSP